MPTGTKIATCCYCGTRAALVLRGKDRHELSCAACGAPLHDMKMLKSEAVTTPLSSADVNMARPKKREKVHATPLPVWEQKSGYSKKKKKKKRKTMAKRFFEEAFDVIEDIFD